MHFASSHGHVPVMLKEVMDVLNCRAGGVYVDGTVGGGGYARAILEASAPDGILLALDWDSDAIDRVRGRLASYGNRLILEKASFADLPDVLRRLGFGPVDGVVVDLGVSSFQLDDPARGFSFQQNGPLDMRMDRNLPRTAADLVNELSESELADLIFHFGEERWSRRIARAIVMRRKESRFASTGELAQLVAAVVPKSKDTGRIHPATRTFQALRLAVNRELETLRRFLSNVLDVVKPGGRVCVVSFHSLEDRIVKEYFREWAKSCRCPLNVVPCRCEGRPLVKILTRKVQRPGLEEMETNPRARSARLRALEKC
ncbi:16S rRNA (cytosine(1402)-N(4))-methyltransferase RsmH [Desulforhabdus amnigena]|jgi:16S rRNA (cytosine1402-N4)-methyltransferase|uniref:Ribosomal RNA small subunit methyltransferase H n=1 Tax=Desulforhabdus amnigena TaxID=40218 RepID=A0A9W6FW88_9BACT|nr:16S rRNA (cytosine(1402)-N(4))-methyltransferase RsmH [Desulforhabdus amnigena]NLJ26750.1 16S rRNA (cytosine(1402)-N(4))-methyltransferase RsmH [Deltaproteobacteria bacterium]GLI35992.1 ribosomal RNA small subunit methyltransferase H [Desulforhabdus amnigena]